MPVWPWKKLECCVLECQNWKNKLPNGPGRGSVNQGGGVLPKLSKNPQTDSISHNHSYVTFEHRRKGPMIKYNNSLNQTTLYSGRKTFPERCEDFRTILPAQIARASY